MSFFKVETWKAESGLVLTKSMGRDHMGLIKA